MEPLTLICAWCQAVMRSLNTEQHTPSALLLAYENGKKSTLRGTQRRVGITELGILKGNVPTRWSR